MAASIMTVCGAIDANALGFTSMHEHILCDCTMFRRRQRRGGKRLIPPAARWEDELTLANRSKIRHNIALSLDNLMLDNEQVMQAEVAAYRAVGGNAIVETSAPGIRSTSDDIRALRRISEATGVHIIASTGLYAEYTWPQRYRQLSFDQYVAYLYDEISNGIGGTGIFPGHIKAAYEIPKQPYLSEYLRAAAYVSRQTGLSLQVHLGPDVTMPELQRYVIEPLMAGGCIVEKTILCHVQLLMGRLELETLINTPGSIPFDLSLHRQLLAQGFVLGFTPFGFEADDEPLGMAHYSDWYILSGLAALIREGYASQLVVGNDIFTKLATCNGGGEGYLRLHQFVVPMLKRCGIAEQDIEQIMIGNPQRILASCDSSRASEG